jgi:hypothetical protein
MDNERLRDELKAKINFIVIGLVSFLGSGVVPFLASAFNEKNDQEIIKTAFPESTIGWVVWGIFRMMIVVINMSIFVAFVNQGKLNVANDKEYIEARTKWLEVQVYRGNRSKKGKKVSYLTPKQHYAKLYSKKGLSLAIGSFASMFTVSFMVLNWDLATFIAITITVVMAIVFGILQMSREEFYWTNDFKIRAEVEYKKMKNEIAKEDENNARQ